MLHKADFAISNILKIFFFEKRDEFLKKFFTRGFSHFQPGFDPAQATTLQISKNGNHVQFQNNASEFDHLLRKYLLKFMMRAMFKFTWQGLHKALLQGNFEHN